MPKLEFTPISEWAQFNFLGKRLFDFLNVKLNASTGNYRGNGQTGRIIFVDIIPRLIVVFPLDDGFAPVVWMDKFEPPMSKIFDGTNTNDGILGLTFKKDGFILGSSNIVNASVSDYTYIVLGS